MGGVGLLFSGKPKSWRISNVAGKIEACSHGLNGAKAEVQLRTRVSLAQTFTKLSPVCLDNQFSSS